jgi:hypothetical protein
MSATIIRIFIEEVKCECSSPLLPLLLRFFRDLRSRIVCSAMLGICCGAFGLATRIIFDEELSAIVLRRSFRRY